MLEGGCDAQSIATQLERLKFETIVTGKTYMDALDDLAAHRCTEPGCTDLSGSYHNEGNARCHGCGSAHRLGGRYAQFWCPACAPPGHY